MKASNERGASQPPGIALSIFASLAGSTGEGAMAEAPRSSHMGTAARADRVASSATAQQQHQTTQRILDRPIAETGANRSESAGPDKPWPLLIWPTSAHIGTMTSMGTDSSMLCNPGRHERIPRPFGRRWLLRRLARGGMGEVYLAATSGIEGAERPCVVKIIRREHATDRSFLARFLDEARVQSQLQHHGVAQVLEASTDDAGEPYVVVEYIEGRSLGEVRTRAIQSGVGLGWAGAVAIAVGAAEALGHVHERTDAGGRALGIVHRDLSPQNVMVSYGGEVKLIDFGTARAENRRCHTISGVVFAKPGYVAPELANGSVGDHRVDVYALGVILWELVAGRRFLQGTASEHLALVAKDERRPPSIAEANGAPLELDRVIARLTAHSVDDRYASARHAASDLAKLFISAEGLPGGERSVRARVADLMQKLYPAEPGRSRAEFAALVRAARWGASEPPPPAQPVLARESDRVAPPASAAAPSVAPAPANAVAPSSAAAFCSGELSAGTMLAGTRYRVVRTLGRGATGVVYEAEHVDLLRRVALKVTTAERASSKDFAQSFRSEAQAIARVFHPNLVMIHDFGQALDGRMYSAIELLDGETLEQRIARTHRLDWREAVAIGIRVCRGLEAAHSAGLIHLDLKPANLFLALASAGRESGKRAAEWEVKILDFGIARSSGEMPRSSEPSSGFSIVGTPEYMAPEQAGRTEVDRRADFYALGCVLYELCTGGLPYVASSAAALVQMKSKGAPEPMRARAPELGLPASLDIAIRKALAPRPLDRYRSAAEFRIALEVALARPRRRRTAARVAGYAILGGALGLFPVALGLRAARARPNAETQPLVVSKAVVLPAYEPGSEPSAAPMSPAPTSPAPTSFGCPTLPAGAQADAKLNSAPPAHKAAPAPQPAVIALPTGSPGSNAVRDVRAAVAISPHRMQAKGSKAGETTELDESQSAIALGAADATLVAELGEAEQELRAGAPDHALSLARKLAALHPQDTRVLRGWAESAAAARAWSEAITAAESWSLFDGGTEPKLFLARMLAYADKASAAVRILESLLDARPECDEARALLADIRASFEPSASADSELSERKAERSAEPNRIER